MILDLEDDEVDAVVGDVPQVFIRPLTIPPGLPWDQNRAARLESEQAAPLDISQLAVRLKRLEAWRPGQVGSFAALYIRESQVGEGCLAKANLGGRIVTAQFRSRDHLANETKRLGALATIGVVVTVLTVLAIGAAVTARLHVEQDLSRLELTSARRLHQAEKNAQLKRQATILADVREDRGSINEMLIALARMSRERSADASIEAFHWRPAGSAVEVRGDGQPYPTGVASRIDRPLRPGVWLWG